MGLLSPIRETVILKINGIRTGFFIKAERHGKEWFEKKQITNYSILKTNDDWDRKELGETRPLYYNERGDNTEPRLDLNFDEYAANATACEEFLYVFTLDHTWECYAINHTYDDDWNIIDTNIEGLAVKEALKLLK